MSRPRIAALISAIVASTSAFLVVSRWSLFGTVAGAVLFTVVNTFVAHWSSEGLDRASGLLRRRLRLGKPSGEPAALPSTSSVDLQPEEIDASVVGDGDRQSPRASTARTSRRRVTVANWVLAGCAVVAVALSVYALTNPRQGETVETVVVHRQVIEKTVTVTTEGTTSVARADVTPQASGDTATTDTTGTGVTDSDPSTTTSDPSTEETEPSTTVTTDPGQTGVDDASPTTTAPDTGTTEAIGQDTKENSTTTLEP
jgi:hypothetical protein